MAIGYTWDVSTVDTYPTKDSKSDVIYTVHWKLTATDDTNKDSDGNLLETGVKSVKYSVLYMKAIKALQEAQARIETLEAKVATLEGS